MMHDHDGITPSELLHAYMEGELDGAHEAALFGMLAESSDLRMEMRDLLAIDSLVQTDSENLLPSALLRDRVMHGAGVGIQHGAPHTGPASPWLLRTVTVGLLSALGAALLTLGGVYLFVLPDNGERIANAPPVRTGAVIADVGRPGTTAALSAKAAPPVTTEIKTPSTITPPRPIAEQNIGERRRVDAGEKIVREITAPKLSAVSEESREVRAITPVATQPATIVIRQAQSTEPIAALTSLPMREESAPEKPEERRFVLGMRGGTAISFPKPIRPNESTPWFREMSAGAHYAIDREHMLGVEVGQEVFSQEYSGVDRARPVTYRQSPLLLWAGVSYQYAPDWLPVDDLHPFNRIVLAGTEAGPLVKETLGLLYEPGDRVALLLGVEGSLLPYSFQGNVFTSAKLGLTYGVTVAF